MQFTHRHIEIFWAVMTTGSATGAAAMLRTSQPTISRDLSRFEKLTDLKLFEKMAGRLVPTESGYMLFEEVKRSYVGLERIRNAVQTIRHFRHGKVMVACLPAFSIALLPRVCQEFQKCCHDTSVSITSMESPVLQESLSSQHYHLGLTEDHTPPPGTELSQILTLDLVCVLPHGHRLCQHDVLTPQLFAGEDFVYLSSTDPYRLKVDEIFSSMGIERRMGVETQSAAAVCATVVRGSGVAIVNPVTALDYHSTGLEIRRFSHSIPFSVSLVRPSYRVEFAAASRFVEILISSCQSIEQELAGIIAQ